MKRLDYSYLNQKYSLGQFRNVPEYLAIMNCDASLKEGIQNCLYYILKNLDIDKAEGFLLEYIADLVGTSRTFFDAGNYFRTNAEDVNVEKQIWFSQSDSVSNVSIGSLSDVNLQRRVKAQIGINTSRCTREDNIRVIKDMFLADSVKISNSSPMMLDIEITGENLLVSQTPRADIEAVLGNGVGINNLVIGE